ncbi:type I polyketide synthase [Streptomyces sp. NRRL B-1347]|uniref:type I polyketide synthase n=1 Tax=Streptomyces sp. NRRL B-1347 TaxID=1476877 RepID=UPI00099CA648|nr:type I polyketide synthase [Streptomyces sp. NRRL B-1347]
MRTEPSDTPSVAIVGMGCRLPGIESVDDLWDVLEANADTVTPVPADRFDLDDRYDSTPMTRGRTVSRHGGFLSEPFGFDAAFFGISPVEARAMDPQQRLLLHVVWEALESAGIRPSGLAGSRGGVFVGQATSEYAETDPRPHDPDVRSLVGSRLRAVTAGRVSYALDLRGPSVVLDTACSSSLVAVHAARQSLLTGESDLCVAAGVNLILSPHDFVAYSQGDMLSPEGHCRFGDARANGFVRSEGVGAVVLKRLDDALRDGDPVRAVLLGSATTNDGAASGLLLHPAVAGQAAMVREACRSAGIEPAELDYVEAHGTGTRVGDGVELQALADAVGPGRRADRPLLTGSVKTNLGHTEATAGMAGLIKAVLMLRHGVVPASLHLDEAHPLLAQEGFPVRVVTRNQPLEPAGGRALLGVSSFGLSGTNAHLVVGAHVPEAEPDLPSPATGAGPCLLVLSARTSGSLRRLAEKYAAYLGPSGPGRRHRLADVCAAAAARRDAHPHRLWVVGHDHETLSRRLSALAAGETIPDGGTAEAGLSGDKRVVFAFSGQGSQWAGMTRSLYRSSPAFRTALDACDQAVAGELGWSVLDRLASDDDFPEDVSVVQPVLWAVQVALAAAWRERGVTPDLCVGHSMGEVAAAHVVGALSLADAAAVICRRSRLMQRTAGRGAMLVVELSAARARQYAEAHEGAVCVAAENSPTTTVLAGDPQALAHLRAELEEHGVLCRSVKVNVASHSPQMDSLRDDLLQELAGLSPVRGTTGMVSTVHGCEVKGPELTAVYWMDNLRRPVQFAGTVREVALATESVFVELSPHPVLVAPMNDTLGDDHGDLAVASLHAGQDEPTELARAAGRIFAVGGRVDWRRWYGGDPRHVPSLPTYAWDVVQFRRDAAEAAHWSGASRVRRIDLAEWAGSTGRGDGAALHGAAPVPPVVHLTAMLETAREADPTRQFALRDVRLGDTHVPLGAAGDTTLRVTLDGHRGEAGEARTVTAQASLRGASDPVFCAWGRVVGADADDSGPSASDALDAALARCREYLGAQDLQRLAQRHDPESGASFRDVEQLWRRDGEAVARVRLTRPLSRADWEAGLQPLLAARPGAVSGDDVAYVPVSFDSVRFFAELEPDFWSLVDVRPEDGGASLRADAVLIAPDRRVLARFSGIRLRRLARPSRASGPLAHVPALVSALAGQCATSFAGLAEKVTGPFGGGFLTGLLRSVASPPADRERESAPARTAVPETSLKQTAALPPERGVASEALLEHAAALLGMAASDIDERRSLRELGLDSLMASQLRQRLRRGPGLEVTAGRLLGPESVASLAKSLAPHGAPPRFGQPWQQEP